MSNHQASNNRGVPAVMQPRVKEPGDPARLEMRGPAGAGEGRRGGTGDGGKGETGSAGSEERRVRSEKGGPDIRRPLDVTDPVSQSAGRGEMRRHRSTIGDRDRRARPDDPEPRVGRHTRGNDGEGERIRGEESQVGRRGVRDRPDDPEPGEGRHLRGDGEGTRIRGEEVGDCRVATRRSKPTGIGFWRLEMQPEWSLRTGSGGVRRKVEGPNDPDSKMMRGSASPGEGKDRMSVSEAAEKLRSSFGNLPPPVLSKIRPGHSEREGFFSPSGHFVQKQRSPTYSSQQKRKAVPANATQEPSIDRFAEASELVNKVNRFSRQKSGGFFNIGQINFTGNCPLCELKCHCLGPNCLQMKGISDK